MPDGSSSFVGIGIETLNDLATLNCSLSVGHIVVVAIQVFTYLQICVTPVSLQFSPVPWPAGASWHFTISCTITIAPIPLGPVQGAQSWLIVRSHFAVTVYTQLPPAANTTDEVITATTEILARDIDKSNDFMI